MQSRFLRRLGHLGKGLFQCLYRLIQAVAACAEGIRQARLRLAGKTQRLLNGNAVAQLLGIAQSRGQNLMQSHVDHGLGLNGHHLVIGIQMNPVSGSELGFGEDTVPGDQIHILVADIGGHSLRGGGQIAQASLCRLPLPFLAVAVAAEDNPAVLGQRLADQGLEGGIEIIRLFQHVREATQFLSHNGVQGNIGAGHGLGGTQHPELKLVAGEGQRAGAVPVGGVLGNHGQHVHADAQDALFRVGIVGAVDDGLHHRVQLIPQINGNDGGRGFAGAQPVVVAGGGHGAAEKILIFVHAGDEGRQEHQEPGVLPGGLAGAEQVAARIRRQGPVVVLAGAVHPGEGLFVKQTHQIVLCRALFHNGHHFLVVVTGGVGIGIDGSQLMLAGSGLVVFGFA